MYEIVIKYSSDFRLFIWKHRTPTLASNEIISSNELPPHKREIERDVFVKWKWSYMELSYVYLNIDVTCLILLQLSAVVDGVYADHSHIAGKFTMLSSSRVHVGGSINTRALPGSRVHNNFVGCMRKVSVFLDLQYRPSVQIQTSNKNNR